MNMLETEVRAALQETGAEVPPDGVPPLRLHGQRRLRLPRLTQRRWSPWLAPLAAAASLAAVVAASLVISTTFHGHTKSTGLAQAAATHGSPAGPASALHLAPPYFVQLSHYTQVQAGQADVRSTVTGHTLATVTPPRPYNVFTWVNGAADGRTFVLAAQRWWHIAPGAAGGPAQNRDNRAPTVFFRLTFSPHTRSAQLTRLPEKIRSSDLGGVGVSPDGTRLALDFRQSIQVITVATGASRTWTWPGSGGAGNWKPHGQIFSWSADGRYLGFQGWAGPLNEVMSVRVLDTSAPGTSLAAARVVVTFPHPSRAYTLVTGNSFLTPDGTRVVAATTFYQGGRSLNGYTRITGYSLTGKPVFTEDKFGQTTGLQEVLWAGPRGNALVVLDPRGKQTRYGRGSIMGVLAGNEFTPIPHSAAELDQVAW